MDLKLWPRCSAQLRERVINIIVGLVGPLVSKIPRFFWCKRGRKCFKCVIVSCKISSRSAFFTILVFILHGFFDSVRMWSNIDKVMMPSWHLQLLIEILVLWNQCMFFSAFVELGNRKKHSSKKLKIHINNLETCTFEYRFFCRSKCYIIYRKSIQVAFWPIQLVYWSQMS